ncbi:MAG: c-type cytochrome [Bryobacteraceae bacterium]|jgi:mono/diheme cytochrome c family protein
MRFLLVPALATLAALSGCSRGAATNGEKLFVSFKCASCHGDKGQGGSAPALVGSSGPVSSPDSMAAAMWSHATKMWQAVDAAKIERPQISTEQASDLYAFLSGGSGGQDPAGTAARGQQVFQAKLCASCHEQATSDASAPNLAAKAGQFSGFSMVSALWQHGSGMLARMVAQNKEWQVLSAQEMADILAYLNAKK